MLAYAASTWTQIVVAISIFVPVIVTVALAFVFLRGKKNDPDEQRLRRAQAGYEARRRESLNESARNPGGSLRDR